MFLICFLLLSTFAACAEASIQIENCTKLFNLLIELKRGHACDDFIQSIYDVMKDTKKSYPNRQPVLSVYTRGHDEKDRQLGVRMKFVPDGPATPASPNSFAHNQSDRNGFLCPSSPRRPLTHIQSPPPSPSTYSDPVNSIWIEKSQTVIKENHNFTDKDERLGFVRIIKKKGTSDIIEQREHSDPQVNQTPHNFPTIDDDHHTLQPLHEKLLYRIYHGKPYPNKLYVAWVLQSSLYQDYEFEFLAHISTLRPQSITSMIKHEIETPKFSSKIRQKTDQEIMNMLEIQIKQVENSYDPEHPENCNMIDEFIGDGVSADVFVLKDEFRSLACKRVRKGMKEQADIDTVVDSVGLYISLCDENFSDITIPTIYLWAHNTKNREHVLYAVQQRIKSDCFLNTIFNNIEENIDRKLKLLEEIHATAKCFSEHNANNVSKNSNNKNGVLQLQLDMNIDNYISTVSTDSRYNKESIHHIDQLPTYFSLCDKQPNSNGKILDLESSQREGNFNAMSSAPWYIALYPAFQFRGDFLKDQSHYERLKQLNISSEYAEKKLLHSSELNDKNIQLLTENKDFIDRLRLYYVPEPACHCTAKALLTYQADQLLDSFTNGNIAVNVDYQQPHPLRSLTNHELINCTIDAFDRKENRINSEKQMRQQEGRQKDRASTWKKNVSTCYEKPECIQKLLYDNLREIYSLAQQISSSRSLLDAFTLSLKNWLTTNNTSHIFSGYSIDTIKEKLYSETPEFSQKKANHKGHISFDLYDSVTLMRNIRKFTDTDFNFLVIKPLIVTSKVHKVEGVKFEFKHPKEEADLEFEKRAIIETVLTHPQTIREAIDSPFTLTFFMYAAPLQESPPPIYWTTVLSSLNRPQEKEYIEQSSTNPLINKTSPNYQSHTSKNKTSLFKEPLPSGSHTMVKHGYCATKRKSGTPTQNLKQETIKIKKTTPAKQSFKNVDRNGVDQLFIARIDQVQFRETHYLYEKHILIVLGRLISSLFGAKERNEFVKLNSQTTGDTFSLGDDKTSLPSPPLPEHLIQAFFSFFDNQESIIDEALLQIRDKYAQDKDYKIGIAVIQPQLQSATFDTPNLNIWKFLHNHKTPSLESFSGGTESLRNKLNELNKEKMLVLYTTLASDMEMKTLPQGSSDNSVKIPGWWVIDAINDDFNTALKKAISNIKK